MELNLPKCALPIGSIVQGDGSQYIVKKTSPTGTVAVEYSILRLVVIRVSARVDRVKKWLH